MQKFAQDMEGGTGVEAQTQAIEVFFTCPQPAFEYAHGVIRQSHPLTEFKFSKNVNGYPVQANGSNMEEYLCLLMRDAATLGMTMTDVIKHLVNGTWTKDRNLLNVFLAAKLNPAYSSALVCPLEGTSQEHCQQRLLEVFLTLHSLFQIPLDRAKIEKEMELLRPEATNIKSIAGLLQQLIKGLKSIHPPDSEAENCAVKVRKFLFAAIRDTYPPEVSNLLLQGMVTSISNALRAQRNGTDTLRLPTPLSLAETSAMSRVMKAQYYAARFGNPPMASTPLTLLESAVKDAIAYFRLLRDDGDHLKEGPGSQAPRQSPHPNQGKQQKPTLPTSPKRPQRRRDHGR
jgi:hypothetical protein